MVTSFIAGFLLSLQLILAIGAQNAFVLRQGLKQEHVGPVVALCCASEGALIFLGIAGFDVLTGRVGWMLEVARWGGVIFLVVYGLRSLHSALFVDDALDSEGRTASSLKAALISVFLMTWANPHVYLDTVGLIGSVSTTYGDGRWWFGLGALLASCLFFALLGYGARLVAPIFVNPRAWNWLDAFVGVTMLALAAKLALGL